ncbi:MAG: ABC transporter permease [Oscillospiraceae bacterium]|nr:ABC transporter permease [Oscillospiraceae bacterium]
MKDHPAFRIGKRTAGYLIRIITLLIATSIVAFILVKLSPIDPVQQYTMGMADVSEEQRQAIADRWGLNDPPVQQYFKWAMAALQGDLGESTIYRRPVLNLIGEKFLNTLALMLTAWVLSGLIGFTLGVIMGVFRRTWLDGLIKRICLVLCSVPTFWLGLVMLLIFSVSLGWFPIGLSTPIGVASSDVTFWQWLHHLILPAVTLSFMQFANIALHTRQKMVDVLESDYVLFATARGESKWSIVKRHGLRNIMLPAITLQFASFAELFGGAVLTENVFSYPGLGSAASEAGMAGDVPLLLGITLFSAAFVFTGNLIANLIYGVVDPRIREGSSGG